MTTSKFKEGDKVRVREDLQNWQSYGGEVVVPSMCKLRGEIVTIREVKSRNAYLIKEEIYNWTDDMLEPVVKTLDDLEVGDILQLEGRQDREVYAIVGKLVAVDDGDDDDRAHEWIHIDDLKEEGWTVKQDSAEPTELSVSELETKLGIPSGTLRVKKDN